jgi:hypothetical protein
VQGIADQGQRPEGETDHQLQGGEAAVEGDAPAEGPGGAARGLVLLPTWMGVMVRVSGAHLSALPPGRQVRWAAIIFSMPFRVRPWGRRPLAAIGPCSRC